MVEPSVAGVAVFSSVLASVSKSSVVESDAVVGAEAEGVVVLVTVSVEAVGVGTVPWCVGSPEGSADVPSFAELVVDATEVVAAITGVVFGLSVEVALALVLKIFGLGDVSDCSLIDALNAFSAK